MTRVRKIHEVSQEKKTAPNTNPQIAADVALIEELTAKKSGINAIQVKRSSPKGGNVSERTSPLIAETKTMRFMGYLWVDRLNQGYLSQGLDKPARV
jgi:hypothetical protein